MSLASTLEHGFSVYSKAFNAYPALRYTMYGMGGVGTAGQVYGWMNSKPGFWNKYKSSTVTGWKWGAAGGIGALSGYGAYRGLKYLR